MDRPATGGQPPTECGIEITPEMIEAGLDEFLELPRGEDLRYVVTSIYLAMEYQRRSDHERFGLLDHVVHEGQCQHPDV